MESNQAPPRSEPLLRTAATAARPVVWVLDDSPMEAAMARRALVHDYDVHTFTDGSTLLERIVTGACPNVLVLDWHLPGLSGIEVCRFLRSTHDEMELPILMLTVYGHKSDLVDGLVAGANDYVTKPYDAPELAARVATLAKINVLHDKARSAERRGAELLARERVARADAETANRTKDEFLAMVSHELRTPLNAILGWTRILRTGSLGENEAKKALATVERNAMAQTELIDELMDMSRILSGKLDIERQPMELVSLVQGAVDAVEPSAAAKGIAIALRVDPDVGRTMGDQARLQQVVLNLLTNAIKFTPKDGAVQVALDRAGDEAVTLTVADTGIGIAADFLPHVFERFRQEDVGSKRSHGGLGLGLAIVKHIVELHDGTVVARSDGSGRGSTFVVTLPRERISDIGRAMTDPLADQPATTRLAGLRVVVVDDDHDTRELIARVLERHGAQTFSASSASEALTVIDRVRPDVIVSDIAMPDRDGHDMIRALRTLPADRGGRTPALALTAFARQPDRTNALAAGFNMYASKPVHPAELVVSIASLAGRFQG